ncbi:MAG TPA: prolipoprotein diacylglyceryl transferase family protein [Terriglobales bacterium]|nr:prolipoprotein diacylglyceryl transferase family protein [Terriglobales bacterium]
MLPYIQVGPLTLGTFGLFVWVGLMVSYYALAGEFRRRRLPGDAANLTLVLGVMGVIGARLYSAFESPRELLAHPVDVLFSRTGFTWHGSVLLCVITLLWWARSHRIPVLVLLDACAPATAIGYGIGRLGCLLSGDGDVGTPTTLPWGMVFPPQHPGPHLGHGFWQLGVDLGALVPSYVGGRLVAVHPTPIYELILAALIFWFLWNEGKRAAQLQRPAGTVVGEYLVLTGVARFFIEFIRFLEGKSFALGENFGRGLVDWYNGLFGIQLPPDYPHALDTAQITSLVSMAAGGLIIAVVVPRYLKGKEEHRILEHVALWGEATQPEYTPATAECPHPERWRMYDTMSAEVEVLDFLKELVKTVKPRLIVETGTFTALSTIKMAEGLREIGSGKLVTIEYDPKVFAKAKERVEGAGVAPWIEMRNASSLETRIDGEIDLLFSDSDLSIREQEVRHFLPQMNPGGLILMHDASSHYKVVREQALRLEAEGLVAVVFLPTPRGLVIAQKKR